MSRPVPPVPAIELRFDGATPATSSGTAARDLRLNNSTGTPCDLFSPAGFGVSGRTGDRALDLRSATRMGRGDNSPAAGPAAQLDFAGVLGASFTLQGWFRTGPGDTLANFARLFDAHDNSTHLQTGFELWAGRMDTTRGNLPADPGHLTLWVNDYYVTTRTAAYTATNAWVFFAASYDGTGSIDNARFYTASSTAPVALLETHALAAGPLRPPTVPLTLGNRDRSSLGFSEFLDRPFRGLLDNLRVFSAVLTAAELEVFRQRDLAPAP